MAFLNTAAALTRSDHAAPTAAIWRPALAAEEQNPDVWPLHKSRLARAGWNERDPKRAEAAQDQPRHEVSRARPTANLLPPPPHSPTSGHGTTSWQGGPRAGNGLAGYMRQARKSAPNPLPVAGVVAQNTSVPLSQGRGEARYSVPLRDASGRHVPV